MEGLGHVRAGVTCHQHAVFAACSFCIRLCIYDFRCHARVLRSECDILAPGHFRCPQRLPRFNTCALTSMQS
jgi:hypothetical protein